jgi:hypothetical protein
MKPSHSERPEIGQILWLDEEVAEISLLLPGWQAAQLVAFASRQQVTAGQLLRDLVKKYLARRTKDRRTSTI